jgi:hypothetical protein
VGLLEALILASVTGASAPAAATGPAPPPFSLPMKRSGYDIVQLDVPFAY